jgi:hypothetical protein
LSTCGSKSRRNPAPSKQNDGTAVLPMISAPASSTRVTTVASSSGTKSSITVVPSRSGNPATAVLSLIAAVRRASGPPGRPAIEQRHAQPFKGFSAGSGARPASLG